MSLMKVNKSVRTHAIINMRQEQEPNFRDEQGQLYLVRCYSCDSKHGSENFVISVASGECAWCGWKDDKNE